MTPAEAWSLVFHRDGLIADSSLEVLGEARRLGNAMETGTVAIVLGDVPSSGLEILGAHGATRVLVASAPQLRTYATRPQVAAVAELIDERMPRLVLVPEVAAGRDLAPRLAARSNLGLVAGCTYVRVDRSGRVVATRPGMGGRIAERVAIGSPGLLMVAPDVFPQRIFDNGADPEIEHVTFDDLPDPAVELVSSKRLEPDDLSLEEAEVVVAGGLGMGGEEGFRSLEKLAAVLGAKVAASRRATDLGWADRAALVGQTGTTVRPALYVACGISGASQHVLGMRESKTVVAVNSDPNAPIFQIADVGVVGDVATVVPELADAFQRGLAAEGGV